MKKLFILFLFFIPFSLPLLHAQSWMWGREGYGPLKSNDAASAVTTDKNGNAYTTGLYETTLIVGNDTLKNTIDNAYLIKYNTAGSVIWARQIIDSTASYGTSVTTDNSGNIYITGGFSGNAYIGSFVLKTSQSNYNNVFLAKYNSNGTVLWAKQGIISSNANCYATGYSVATDKAGNVLVTGHFQDTLSFGSFTLKTGVDNTDVFLVKYDSTGKVLWAEQSTIPSGNCSGRGYSVTTDNLGNCYVTGYFSDTISFGATTLTNSRGITSGFLVKYSSAGNMLWAKQTVAGSTNSSCQPYAVITDQSGRPYITGSLQDTVSFGSYTLHSPSGVSACFAQYDTNGNVVWAKQSSVKWQGTGLASDVNHHIYMAGGIYKPDTTQKSTPDTLRFGNYSILPDFQADYVSFLMKFDTSGTPLCGSILNNLGYASSLNGVASDLTGTYIYTASTLVHTVFCGPDTLPPHSSQAIFLARWLACKTEAGINELQNKSEQVKVFPNPSNGIFNLVIASETKQSQCEVEVYNVLGQPILTETLSFAQGDNSINLSSQSNGIYLYRVTALTGELVGEGKVMVQR